MGASHPVDAPEVVWDSREGTWRQAGKTRSPDSRYRSAECPVAPGLDVAYISGLRWSVLVDARLRISRLSGWGTYRIVLDGGDVGALGRGKSVEMEVPSGAHMLRLVYRFGLGSSVETFIVRAGETAAFACRPRPLRGGSWIALDRTNHKQGGSSGGPNQDLIVQITAAQANQPGIRR